MPGARLCTGSFGSRYHHGVENRAGLTKSWTQSPKAFHRFLSWLDDGVESSGERYVEMRRRLVSYFGRKRCLAPDELADETLTRVARKLEEQGEITDTAPARYLYIIARFVFLEYLRGADHRQTSLAESVSVAAAMVGPALPADPEDTDEALLDRQEQPCSNASSISGSSCARAP